ncbi:hypothetical protein [Burkholderia multivorans]|uniref:hypothetical protein n=1 Tax=Burkholderia multivorans TaxID=87883 RepID=UPI000B09A4BE|nr:hypothetical protein [Burkholderia multivorans]
MDAHQALVADLNRQLGELGVELRAAVRAGIDTTKIRRRIESVETDIEAAIERAAQAEADAQQRIAEEAAEQGARIAAAVTQRVAAAIEPFNFTEDPSMTQPIVDAQAAHIQHAAHQVAAARAELARATAAHHAAQAEVQALQSRINDAEARRSAITAKRLAGTSDAREAAEFVALGADIDVLRGMLADAERAANQLVPTEQSTAVARAEEALRRAEAEAEFSALTGRVREIEGVLLDAVRALRDAGTQLGHHHLSVSYRAGDDLRRLLTHGVL